MWLRMLARTIVFALVTVQLATPDEMTQTPGDSGPSAAATLWTDREWAQARRFSPLPPPPADPTNALADNLQAARLGHRLFFDPRLSPKGVACATCHQPERGFTDGLTVANTLAPLQRNTMTILNVGYYQWLTWDGARDSLWHQAAAPLESPKEMGSSRLSVVQAVMQGLPRLRKSLFRSTGPYADGPPVVRAEDYPVGQALMGSFRTPSLRELASTAPYGHNGAIATLEAWLEHYVAVTSSPAETMLGTLDSALAPIEITPQAKQELTAFLLALSSAYTSVWTQKPAALQRTPEP
jgi:cytochrome c peroxidase